MKEETKSKLKKFGKRAGLGLGFVALFLLGVGVGACSARKAVGSSAEYNAPTMAQPRRVAPPLSPTDFPTLDPSEDNLLLNAYAGHYVLNTVDNDYQASENGSFDCYLLEDLPVGLYMVECESTRDGWAGLRMLVNGSGASQVKTGLNLGASSWTLNHGNYQSASAINTYGSSVKYYYSITDGFDSIFLQFYQAGSAKVSCVDAKDIPASKGYDFPTEFFPYGLSGNRKSEYFCGGPSVSSGTYSSTYIVALNGLYFESNGTFYNSILLTFSYRANMPVLYYTDTGALSVRTTAGENTSDPNYFPLAMSYGNTIDPNVEPVEVWQANFASVDAGNFNYGLLAGGLWLNPAYRHINVVAFYAPSVVGLPSSAIGQYSVEGWLDWLAVDRVIYDPTNTQGNPFTLLGQGFTAVGGILQIQILPMITLGTLIFVPLVVLVIMAILKILNK